MKTKRTFFAVAAAVAGTWIMPAPAVADPAPPYSYTACDASTCTLYECSTAPNLNGSGFDTSACSPVYSYPRQREVDGGGGG
jgi:hypothetical protein